MKQRTSYVSVIDPISPAIERVSTILFRPFDLQRWFVIGFCAWLARLGKGGGGGGGGGGRGDGGRQLSNLPAEIRDVLQHARDYVTANLDWVIVVGALVLVLMVALTVVAIWLSSRGRFMFLHCVAQNTAEVVRPWRQFATHANSLFVFRLVVGFIAAATAITFLLLGGTAFFVFRTGFGLRPFSIAGAVVCTLLSLATAVVFFLIAKLTTDFVVPTMYLHTASCLDAWRRVLDLLSANKARLFLYLAFQFAMSLAIGALVLAMACLTCGCACCLFMLPYVSTLVLLPVFVFTRSYSLHYLAQYGPEWDVFPAEAERATLAGPPVAGPPAGSPGQA